MSGSAPAAWKACKLSLVYVRTFSASWAKVVILFRHETGLYCLPGSAHVSL